MAFKMDHTNEETGKITYSKKVLLNTIGIAAKEISGVADLADTPGSDFRRLFSSNYMRGIKMELDKNSIDVDVFIKVYENVHVPTIAYKVQENIKKNIESTTGYTIRRVDVHVTGVVFSPEEYPANTLND